MPRSLRVSVGMLPSSSLVYPCLPNYSCEQARMTLIPPLCCVLLTLYSSSIFLQVTGASRWSTWRSFSLPIRSGGWNWKKTKGVPFSWWVLRCLELEVDRRRGSHSSIFPLHFIILPSLATGWFILLLAWTVDPRVFGFAFHCWRSELSISYVYLYLEVPREVWM